MLPSLLAVEWPMIVFPTLVGGGLITMGWLWLRHTLRRSRLEGELDEFKTRVVRSGEVMDALREKHRTLPATDPDFAVPMAGETLAEYEAIEGVLERYRDRWLELMDVWDDVQALVEGESTGRVGKFEQAAALLADAGQLTQLAALESECKQRLARLENAHEAAVAAAENVTQLSSELADQLDAIRQHGFDPEAYRTERTVADEHLKAGSEQLEPDPLGAATLLGRARSELENLIRRAVEVLDCENAARQLDERLDEHERRIEQLRQDGFLFSEPEASPEAPIVEYRRLRDELSAQLNRGAIDAATRTRDAMQRQLDQIATLLDTCVEMRTNSRLMLDERRAGLRRLLDEASAADLEEEYMSMHYPVEAWRAVVDNLNAARLMVATMSEMLAEAESAMNDETQHYLRGKRLIDEVAQRETEVSQTIAGVAVRRRELDDQRESCRERIARIESAADRVGRLLQESRADRDLCNHRYRMARDRMQDILRATSSEPTDWPAIALKVEQCGADLQRVEDLFQQDLQVFRQAQSEITQAEQEIRRARSFYRAGVSADTTRADGILLDARSALADQHYERAVQHANQAEQAARDARAEAEQEMHKRQRQRDRVHWEQRQRQMRSLVEGTTFAAVKALQEIVRR